MIISNSKDQSKPPLPLHIARVLAALDGVQRNGGGWIALCPAHDDRKPSLSIGIGTNNRLLLYCHAGCTFEAVINAIAAASDGITTGEVVIPKLDLTGFRRAQKQKFALGIWCAAGPAKGTVVETYLRARGITLAAPDSLRFHPTLQHPDGWSGPAMIAAVSDASGEIVAIHRTYLLARLKTDKRMLGPCGSNAVWLARPGRVIAVAEGIETALSAMQMQGLPTWAALSASGLQNIKLPRGITEVIICADGDAAGRAGAQALARRLICEGRTARIRQAPDGKDFNDVLRSR